MKKLTLILLIAISVSSFAQDEYYKLTKEGFMFLEQKNYPIAIKKYEQALRIDSTKVEANYGLGVAYLFGCQTQEKDCYTALHYLNKAIDINDTYRNSYYNRGGCKTVLKDYSGAMKDYNTAISQNSKNPAYYIGRAFIYKNLGDKENLCKDLKTAKELGFEPAERMLISIGCSTN